jgi:hypothetical protein
LFREGFLPALKQKGFEVEVVGDEKSFVDSLATKKFNQAWIIPDVAGTNTSEVTKVRLNMLFMLAS